MEKFFAPGRFSLDRVDISKLYSHAGLLHVITNICIGATIFLLALSINDKSLANGVKLKGKWFISKNKYLLSIIADSSLYLSIIHTTWWKTISTFTSKILNVLGVQWKQGKSSEIYLMLLHGTGMLVLCLLLNSLIGLAIYAAVLISGSFAYAHVQHQKHDRELISAIPVVYRTISVALASGNTLAQAFEYVSVHAPQVIAPCFNMATIKLRCGAILEDVISELSDDIGIPSAQLLGTALIISHRTGASLQGLLYRSAKLVEKQVEFERRIITKTAQVRLSVKIVIALPFFMVGILTLLSPDFRNGLTSSLGLVCVTVAMILDVIAIVVIKMLLRSVLS